jgi:hypothetical protein
MRTVACHAETSLVVSSTHRTTIVITPAGEAVPIDDDMVSLISLLWAHGVRTVACCQGDPKREGPTIVFPSAADLEAALAVLYDLSPEELRPAVALRHSAEERWRVDAWAKLWWAGSRTPTVAPDGVAPFYYQLAMPGPHLDVMRARLEAAAAPSA